MAAGIHNSALPLPASGEGGFAVTSQWISANAGSGKTYVLTREVVTLLLLGVAPERICCITYTKAAAGEMRGRVISLLRSLLLADDAACAATITELTGRAATPALMERARLLFGTVLDSTSGGIQFTTIHGFCQHLLRAFPLEAGVPPHFTVADESQAAQLLAQVKRRLLTGSGAVHGKLADAIALLAERCGETRFDSLIKAMLNTRGSWHDAWAGQTEESYRARLYALAGVEESASEENLAAQAMGCLNAEDIAHLRTAIRDLQQHKNAREQKLAASLAEWLARPVAEWPAMVDDWLDLWLTQKGEPRKALVNEKDFPPHTTLRQILARCTDAALRFAQQRSALALAQESYASALLARQLIALYEQVKSERGVLDYDDLITSTRELLTTRDMVGWVMSKLDHRIDHLLLDEAQDTSAEQWRIAHVLVDELVATSEGIGSSGVPRSLFVVGDEKQSIFSFQGAAPELYADKQQDFTDLLRHAYAPLASTQLVTSYRSAPAILAVVDAVAQQENVRNALSATGTPQHHEAKRHQAAGSVVLHPPIAVEEKTPPLPFTIPIDYVITRSAAQLLAETVAGHIAQWIAQGTWRAGDILILTRNRKPIVHPLLRALQRAGVPVAGIDRLVLADHLAVKDLLALMRWCASTQDDLALAQVLRSPLLDASEDDLHRLAMGRGALSLWQRVREMQPAHAALLEQWRDAARQSPYDFLTCILETHDARRRFSRRFGEEIHEILDELKEQASAMPAAMAPTIANFVAWIAGSDREIKRELEQGTHDHVRVMTVHGAKGLEAPLVLLVDTIGLPNLNKELFSSARDAQGQYFPLLALSDEARAATHWRDGRTRQLHAQMQEYYRLLYVALTRAKDALHLYAVAPARGDINPACWYDTVARAMHGMGAQSDADGALRVEDSGFNPAALTHAPQLQTIAIPAWARDVAPKPRQAPVLSPSKLARDALAPFSKQRGESARARGVRLHRVLQFMTADTTRAQLQALLAHQAPDWNEKQRAQAEAEIWALFTAEPWLWAHASQAEVNISGTITIDGMRYPVLGQIDKLVDTGDALVVLDYKTSRDIPPGPSAVGDAYLLQLKLYTELLANLYPSKRIRPAIVWTANASLMWLDAAVEHIPWARATLA